MRLLISLPLALLMCASLTSIAYAQQDENKSSKNPNASYWDDTSDTSNPTTKKPTTPVRKKNTTTPKDPVKKDRTNNKTETNNQDLTKNNETSVQPVDDDRVVPTVEIIGTRLRDLLEVPGSAAVITKDQIEDQSPVDANSVLRKTPGVHVVDEEGLGLRPNISFRGVDPERSRGVLVLEDGVPIASAPYINPGMYYAPLIDRVERIEVIKGSGSILHGPQTIGGVLNYVTANPPDDFQVKARAAGGTDGYLMGRFSIGDSYGQSGYLVDVTHKRFDGPRRGINGETQEFSLTDVMVKFKLGLGPRSRAGLKFQYYDEFSRSTYLGLTSPQFDNNPRSNFADYDRFPVRRYAVTANHEFDISPEAIIQTTVYANQHSRNWQRQDFERCINDTSCDTKTYERIVGGDGTLLNRENPAAAPKDGSAVYFQNSTGNRNRSYYVTGAESRLTYFYKVQDLFTADLAAGIRLHTEEMLNQRINGSQGNSPTGVIRDDERYYGQAMALYVANRFLFLDEKLRFSQGVRFELFNSQRKIYRQRDDNGVPTDLRVPIDESSLNRAFIPGIGISYDFTPKFTAFFGSHRGFAPPRTQDAIDNNGDVIELEPEYSVNYELGARYVLGREDCRESGLCLERDFLFTEATGFFMDFSQQIIEPTEASGAVGTDKANAGETSHLGAEVGVTYDPLIMLGLDMQAPITLNYTFVNATFGDSWNQDIAGNRLPYAPQHMLSMQLGFKHPVGISAQVAGHYVGEQFSDKENTETPSVDGTRGVIDGRFLLDANIRYTYQPWKLGVFLAGKNLTNQPFIASRRPRGIQPAGFLQIFGGVDWTY